MRGIFTAGVLDAFLESGFDPFSMYYGVSVGASALSSFLAGQKGRHLRIFTEIASRPEFMSLGRMLRGGSFMDLDWLWNRVESTLPLDTTAIDRHLASKQCGIVCTNASTGRAAYIHPKGHRWITVLKASSALPVLYRKFPEVEDVPMADGGLSDPIPVMEAFSRGARRIIVIRTRPLSLRERPGAELLAGTLFMRKYPALRKTLRNHVLLYNRIIDFMASPPPELELIQIAPETSMKTKRTSKGGRHLTADYLEGQDAGRKFLQRIGRDS
jgi:predicted patatin/cPLA2 family phospholipase